MELQGQLPEKGRALGESWHSSGPAGQGARRPRRPAAPRTVPAPEVRGPWISRMKIRLMVNAPFPGQRRSSDTSPLTLIME